MSIPLRVFDRNQGEKLRTRLDIDRNERITEAARTQVLSVMWIRREFSL